MNRLTLYFWITDVENLI